MIASGHRWALMHELRRESEPSLEELCALLSPCDMVLVEGYKFSGIPKLEVHRAITGHPLLYPNDPNIIAVVSDSKTAIHAIQVLDIDAPQQVADHILNYYSFARQ